MSSPRKFKLGYTLIVFWTMLLGAATVGAQQLPAPVGAFTGNLSSRNFDSFPATITIVQDTQGKLTATATLASKCISVATLKITLSGSSITLVGSDTAGDNISFRGQIDTTARQMGLSYIVNGSASGRCETDSGSGTISKQ